MKGTIVLVPETSMDTSSVAVAGSTATVGTTRADSRESGDLTPRPGSWCIMFVARLKR